MNIQDCLKKRFLIEEPLDQKLITKELNESSFDFKSVEKAFDENNFKWVIIQCYYSMFHAAKSVCFNLGYREKKHFALLIILEYLNEQGQLEKEFVTLSKRKAAPAVKDRWHARFARPLSFGLPEFSP